MPGDAARIALSSSIAQQEAIMATVSNAVISAAAATPRDAEKAALLAFKDFVASGRAYGSSRRSVNKQDVDMKRWSWGLDGITYIRAVMVLGEVEDRYDAAAATKMGQHIAKLAAEPEELPAEPSDLAANLGSARRPVRDYWDVYKSLRTDPARDDASLGHVRSQLEYALNELVQRRAASEGEEDARFIADLQRRQELAMTMRPEEAFVEATPWMSHAEFLAREQTRREALERDRHRYDRPRPKRSGR
jgi:hypothetical protein